jgi:hypothetical protein
MWVRKPKRSGCPLGKAAGPVDELKLPTIAKKHPEVLLEA